MSRFVIKIMNQDYINLQVPFVSIVEMIEFLDLDHLLKLRDRVKTQIIDKRLEDDEDDLSSESEIDYSFLQEFLSEGDWETADRETANLILKAAGQTGDSENGELLFVENVEKIPAKDLKIINHLWVKYSNGRFGFSVQKQIWDKAGQDNKKFGDLVGWRVKNQWIHEDDLKFSYDAPVGYLPFVRLGLTHTVETWSSELFTDSQGEDQCVDSAEAIEAIEMWEVLVDQS